MKAKADKEPPGLGVGVGLDDPGRNFANGSVFSYGMALGQEGIICTETMRQLRVVRAAVRLGP